ncbi:SulP family inorganic anion transporter [Balneatrix alpica]|uniref:SulP family inorganic anion transporter n=1 Tax=Balneatrix alpica TaxID=75684 RepID=A0ABV5Z9C0_9GAMM|nr:sulfate permease [Balneatrix alpica]
MKPTSSQQGRRWSLRPAWSRGYNLELASQDALAALIVTLLLIPQSLAYALLAGLPLEVGLYASVLPLIAYALFGSSRTLSVGPVAVLSLMTAAAVSPLAAAGSTAYVLGAVLLALLSGAFLLLMGILRLGFLANFLSHPVISAFISASALLIAASQLQHLLQWPLAGHTLLEMLMGLDWANLSWHGPTLAVSALSLLLLLGARHGFTPLLLTLGMPAKVAALLSKTGPVWAVLLTTALSWWLDLASMGVAVVGTVPQGLPSWQWPSWDWQWLQQLWMPALLLALVGFVESVSVAQTLGARRRQRIDPNKELVGLGMANLGSAFTGGLPVTGGFSRSVVNFDAGAQTPAAGIFAAGGIALVMLWFTPALAYLPKATLAATILVAILALVDGQAIKRTWRYSRQDGAAMLVTLLLTLVAGVEMGILAGVALSLLLYIHRTSTPHSALVGRLPGTEHFRNVQRYQVETDPRIATLRVDESLYFANARFLEDRVDALLSEQPALRHLILMCPAVNWIDASALESLEAINQRLQEAGVQLHLSEVKGPVMDQFKRSHFLQVLSGQVYISQFEAWQQLRQQLPVSQEAFDPQL